MDNINLLKLPLKLLTISINCGIILGKSISKSFTILSSLVISLIVTVISFINFNNERLIYVATRLRNITSVKFSSVISSTEKLRQATLVKFRTIFANKDTLE